jgi:hypothetical protein
MRIPMAGATALTLALSVAVSAQPQRGAPGRGGAGAAATARSLAPIDLTGYWVSVITEDWRYRMMTGPKGDHPGLPLNGEGVRVANSWDPATDEAAGEQCKAYGAGGVMRAPGRLRITWDSDNALRLDTEAGTQTRIFAFGQAAAAGAPSWQGTSVAAWEIGGRRGNGGAPSGGTLRVVTTHMKAGYLQKNGVPYGENALLLEYFNRATEANGDTWLLVTHILDDPQYLTAPLIRSSQFKKLPDSAAAQWAPEACTAR